LWVRQKNDRGGRQLKLARRVYSTKIEGKKESDQRRGQKTLGFSKLKGETRKTKAAAPAYLKCFWARGATLKATNQPRWTT